MAHWAQLNEDNIVTWVTVGNNDEPDEGYNWLLENVGGRWIKTSYNTRGGVHTLGGVPLRKNYANPGYLYDEELDAFIAPMPTQEGEWTLNQETCLWERSDV
jgi:hypothetical protein